MPEPFEVRLSDGVSIWCGDCLHVIPTLSEVAAIITDPPYSSGGMMRGDRMASTREKYQGTDVDTEHPNFTGDNRDQRGFTAWASLWLSNCIDITVPGGVCCLFSDWRQLPCMTDALQAGGWVWRGILPWDKVQARPMPNRFRAQCEYVAWGTNGPRSFDTAGATYHDGILRGTPPTQGERVHCTQKPVAVMARLVEIACEGSAILDPFMGSGSTGVACIRTGRKFIGIEKDARHFEIARARLEHELRQLALPLNA
jgi:site-specific DNA-methyltransferase (adenine-specific)